MPGTASTNGFSASRAWKNTSGFWALPRSTGRSGSRARRRWAATQSSSTRAVTSASVGGSTRRDLVRRPEAVEEVEERHSRLEGGRVRDECEVGRLLDRARRQHRPSRRAGGHHVAVVPEDRERVGRDRSSRDVDDRRRELARDLEHVREHEEQPLRRGERGSQRATRGRTVEGAGRACLRLHLDDLGDGAPEVGPARRRPRVAVLGHRRRRRDRVDGDHLGASVGDLRRRFVAVEDLPGVHRPQGSPAGQVRDKGPKSPFRDAVREVALRLAALTRVVLSSRISVMALVHEGKR